MWESNDRDAWVADAQRWIRRIIGVKQCRIILDDQGEIQEVNVVAGTDKAPRRIVRDIETLFKARLQIDINYKKISVVPLVDTPPEMAEFPDLEGRILGSADQDEVTFYDSHPYFAEFNAGKHSSGPALAESESLAPEAAPVESSQPETEPEILPEPVPAVILAEDVPPRLVCSNVGLMSSDQLVTAEVQLRAGEIEALGTCEGPNHAGSEILLIARATLAALEQIVLEPVLLHVREIRSESLGQQEVILAAIDLVEGRRSETLFGSCSTRHNRQQAVVHSVLDALNRRLSLFGLKTRQSEA